MFFYPIKVKIAKLEEEIKILKSDNQKSEIQTQNSLKKIRSDYDFQTGRKFIANQEYSNQINDQQNKNFELEKRIEDVKKEIQKYTTNYTLDLVFYKDENNTPCLENEESRKVKVYLKANININVF